MWTETIAVGHSAALVVVIVPSTPTTVDDEGSKDVIKHFQWHFARSACHKSARVSKRRQI